LAGPDLSRKIDRILAMGYTEASRRQSAAAKLDVLVEVTAAVCDLVAPDPPDGTFYLSHVDVLCEGTLRSSTLAEFDADIATWKRSPCPIRDGWGLLLPDCSTDVVEKLRGLWEQSIKHFVLAASPATADHQPDIPPPPVISEFHASLRHAFDAIVDEASNAFTLRVHPHPTGYKITDKYIGHQVLGYWLPSSRLIVAYERLSRSDDPLVRGVGPKKGIALLETLVLPSSPTDSFRSQSHTNVATRTAGLVRGQPARSSALKRNGPRVIGSALDPLAPPIEIELMTALEQAVWGGVDPVAIFMMPLTNHEFTGDATPQTVAHWYIALHGEYCLESILARRYRASSLFSEMLYRQYCSAIGQDLALRLLRGEISVDGVNGALANLDAAYSLALPIRVQPADRALESLASRIQRARDARVPGLRTDRAWGQEVDALLHELSLTQGSSRPSVEVDILLALMRALETESNRLHGRGYSAFEHMTQQLEKARVALREMSEGQHHVAMTIEAMRGSLGYGEVAWPRVLTMQRMVRGGGACPHDEQRADEWPLPIRGWHFALIHDPCDGLPEQGGEDPDAAGCRLFLAERSRRLRYLLGWSSLEPAGSKSLTRVDSLVPPSEALRQWTNAIEEDSYCQQRLWDVIKRASQYASDDRPTIATLVLLLWIEGVRVEWDSMLNRQWVQEVPREWKLGLKGVAELTKPSPEYPGKPAEVKLAIEGDRVCFELIGEDLKYQDWFKGRVDEIRNKVPRTLSSNRLRDIAAAYMVDWEAPIAGPDDNGMIGRVGMKVSGARLICSWHGISLAEARLQ